MTSPEGATSLDELLGLNPNDPAQVRARGLVEADTNLMRDLRALRKRRGLTVEDIAHRVGASPEAIAYLESGEQDPRLSTLRRYALALGVTVTHKVESAFLEYPSTP